MGNRGKNKLAIVLVGPTGVGKTELSILIASEIPVEIVSADSRQIYKYMDIGTAKPSNRILSEIPHHFINILEPDQDYSAGQFGLQARAVIDDIFQRERTPLIVGGSGLYIKALLEGFFEGDVRDEKIRKSLEKRLVREGSQSLYEELVKLDRAAAMKIHTNNSQRIIRALEVCLAANEKFSDLQRKKLPKLNFRVLKFGINKPRAQLYDDINRRVDQMFSDGLVEEVSGLLDRGYKKSLNSLNSVGYKEVIDYLEGSIDFETCVDLVKQNSRRYAKRQLTWFRADHEIKWFSINEKTDIPMVAKQIIQDFQDRLKNKIIES
ncbi:MAG: tRNA (adenosine(37)-N6)-dimethylallyltransferase MiaA [Calditrichota bacterium]